MADFPPAASSISLRSRNHYWRAQTSATVIRFPEVSLHRSEPIILQCFHEGGRGCTAIQRQPSSHALLQYCSALTGSYWLRPGRREGSSESPTSRFREGTLASHAVGPRRRTRRVTRRLRFRGDGTGKRDAQSVAISVPSSLPNFPEANWQANLPATQVRSRAVR